MKENQRIVVTKKMLKDALFQLLKKKDIDHISVKELCETAGINRSTFYRHYDSQYALMEEIIDHLAKMVIECNETISKDNAQSNASIKKVIEYFYTHREESFLFIQNPALLAKLLAKVQPFHEGNMETALQSKRYSGYTENEREYIAAFVMEGSVAIQKKWMLSGMRESPDEISELILKICQKCIGGSLK